MKQDCNVKNLPYISFSLAAHEEKPAHNYNCEEHILLLSVQTTTFQQQRTNATGTPLTELTARQGDNFAVVHSEMQGDVSGVPSV